MKQEKQPEMSRPTGRAWRGRLARANAVAESVEALRKTTARIEDAIVARADPD